MKTRYDFDKSIDRRKTHSYKWDIPENELSFTVADTDFFVADEIQEAIVNRAKDPTFGYTFVPNEYYEAYIYWWKHRYNTEYKREWFIFSTSVVASLDSVIKRVSKVGDNISVFAPNYNVFFNCINNNKRNVLEVPLSYQNHEYHIDWEMLETAIKNSAMFIHCNPHNPVGHQYTKEENKRIIELCKKYDTYLFSDEIHSDLDYNENRYNPVILSGSFSKLIIAHSPGKTFNLAGLHSSVLVIPDKELRELIEKGLGEDDVGEPSYFSIEPVIAAYTKCEDYVNEENAYLAENKRILSEFLRKNHLNLPIIGGHATYLLWLDVSYYYEDSVEFKNEFEKKCGVVVLDGKHYHEHHSSFIRINIATQQKNIIHLCNALKEFLSK